MAVYTDVSDTDLAAFLTDYDIGEMVALKGIAEGVENSNYLLRTQKAGVDQSYILTLYEKRVDANDLPFFLGLMDHLADKGINCPTPVHGKDGEALRQLNDRPAAIVSFLDGMSIARPGPNHCKALGHAMAEMHLAADGFALTRPNALGLAGWQDLADGIGARADEIAPGLAGLIADELTALNDAWPQDLPQGVTHADLFPDNVFFRGDDLSGLIDFYFACNDLFAYDICISLNAWCFEAGGEFNITKARALLAGYQEVRALTDAEHAALPLLARGAALRFLLTRAHDWLNPVEGALVPAQRPERLSENPALSSDRSRCRGLWHMSKVKVDIWTDGACSGNPGPGGWGVLMKSGDHEKELSGGDPETTNNRMELIATIEALKALKKPAQVTLYTDSKYVMDGITKWIAGWKKNGWRTAAKKPVKNVDLWQALDGLMDGPHDINWRWVKGHAGDPGNERADQLARDAIQSL